MVAATSSPDARGSPPPERLRLLRELGARVVPAWAALDTPPDGGKQLVVVERIERGASYNDQEIGDWVRDARRLATLEHPNIGRVRDVVIRGEEVLVVSDFVDGVRCSELMAGAERPPLEIALRILVDALSGLGALHNLRDAKREPLKLFHAELTPECIVVGLDGVARVISACRVKSARARPGRGGSAYLAPEILLEDDSADARSDVYSAGVILWEALTGRSLFPNTQPSAIVTALLSGRMTRATVPAGSPWAAPLADVAARTLSADPSKRFPSAAALAAELRRIAGPKLPPPARVATYVRGAFGDRIQARRAALERGETASREVSKVDGVEAPPSQELAEVDVSFSPADRPSAIPTPIPPSNEIVAVPVAPPPLPPPRPRMPTLQGVAPAAVDVVGPGAPVVVPSSSRPPPPNHPNIAAPTPMVAFEIPSAARVPIDLTTPALLEEPVIEGPTDPWMPARRLGPPPLPAPAPVLVPAPEPVPVALAMEPAPPTPAVPAVPAVPLATSMPVLTLAGSTEAPRHPRNTRLIALVLLPVGLVLAVLVWALALMAPKPAAAPSAPPLLSASGAPVASTPAPIESVSTAPSAPPPLETAAAVPTLTVTPPPEPPVSALPPLPEPTATTKPAWTSAPWTPPAAPPPTPRDKRKYEPEGI